MPKPIAIEFSLQAWADALNKDPHTLKKMLLKVGIDAPKHGELLSANKIFSALMGDEYKERVRNLKADADRKEREERIATGALFPMAELESWLHQNYVTPMWDILKTAPTTLDTRCNSEHPAVARDAIRAWIEGTVKPALKENLEKPK